MFDILATGSMMLIAGASYYFKNTSTTNDHEKIIKIADACGLKTKEGTIRIYRKLKRKNYTEYIYKMPLGLSTQQFYDKQQSFVDGLNNKSQLKFDLKHLIGRKRVKVSKHLQITYDGMLHFKVYNVDLERHYTFNDEILMNDFKTSIGYSYDGLLAHDFDKRPHMLVAGTTGFGKSNFIKMIITSLIKQNGNNIKLHLIDLKNGNELGIFKNINQCSNFARDSKQALESLKEIQNHMNIVLDKQFETGKKSIGKERHFVVIDEAADLDKDSRDIVVDIARRGRSAGFRLIYATQYPTNECLPSQIRANVGVRICFRLETNIQSRAVLDEGGAETLPEIEGRAIFRRVTNHTLQTPYIDDGIIESTLKPFIRSGTHAKSEPKKGKDTFSIKEM